MRLTDKQQRDILYTMKNHIDGIRNYRIYYGVEHPKHTEIWQEIDFLYNRLNYKYQEEFNYYCC